jgi:DNA repair ATPase RecN
VKYDKIALIHKRSFASIKSKIISHIVYPIYLEKIDEISVIDLSKCYKVELIDICKYIHKMQHMLKPIHSDYDILHRIEKRLNNIETKIEELERHFSHIL